LGPNNSKSTLGVKTTLGAMSSGSSGMSGHEITRGTRFASSQRGGRIVLEKRGPKTSAFHDLHIKSHSNVR
jgi:hypothetical protein